MGALVLELVRNGSARLARLVLVAALALIGAAPAQAQGAAILEGTVTDRATGFPVPGAALLNCPDCPVVTMTDASGHYSMTLEQQGGISLTGNLYARAAGYFLAQTAYEITTFPTTVNLSLLPGGTVIEGTITDAVTHAAIPGAFARFFVDAPHLAINGYADGTADAAGHYAVDSSQFPEAAAAGLTVSTSQSVAAGYFVAFGGSFSVTPPVAAHVDIALAPRPGPDDVALAGTITDRQTGAPLAGAALLPCPDCAALAMTDADGHYSLTLAQLNISGDGGLLYVRRLGYYLGQTSYLLTSGVTTADLSLLPGGTVIEGTITDAVTHTAIPGAFARFFVDPPHLAINGYADGTADAAGHYAVDSAQFPEGAASGLTVSSSQAVATDYFVAFGGAFSVAPPVPAHVDIALTRRFGPDDVALEGTITDRQSGAPLAGAAILPCQDCAPLTMTDADGHYSLTLAQLNTSAEGGILYVRRVGYFLGQTGYVLAAGVTTVNLSLLPGGTVIEGTITDAVTHAVIPGALARFFVDPPHLAINGYADGTADASGHYAVDSSQFPEAAAIGLTVGSSQSVATGYFVTFGSTFSVMPPVPAHVDIELVPHPPSKQPATLVIASAVAAYDGSPKSVTVTTGPANLSGVHVTYNGSEVLPVQAGTYAVRAVLENSDFEAPEALGTLTITPAASVSTVNCPATTAYSGSGQAPCTATVTGAGGLNLVVMPVYANNTNAGTATASYAYSGDVNHDASSGAASFVITKAELTARADDLSKVAGAVNPALTVSYSGFVGGETLATSGVSGAPVLSTTATAASGAGTYPIVVSIGTLSASNYTFVLVPGQMTVTPAAGGLDGRMFGHGFLDEAGRHHHFTFRVTQQRGRDAGRFEYWVRTAERGRNRDEDDDDGCDGDDESDYGREHRSALSRFEATAVQQVTFSDDPAFRPGGRPEVDTVLVTGVGRWNGQSGYAFELRAADRGEPGRSRDTVTLVITKGANVVASVTGVLAGGNIQSTRLRR